MVVEPNLRAEPSGEPPPEPSCDPRSACYPSPTSVSLIRRLFRDRRSALASWLVVCLITTMLGPLLHADDGHDPDFAPPIVHDASQHRLMPDAPVPGDPGAEQHCVACHFVRLMPDDVAVDLAVRPQSAGVRVGFDRAGHVVPQSGGPPLPARAPPAPLSA